MAIWEESGNSWLSQSKAAQELEKRAVVGDPDPAGTHAVASVRSPTSHRLLLQRLWLFGTLFNQCSS